jgi:hypothetical protein
MPAQRPDRLDQVMATNGMGSDIGAKAGVGALEQVGRGYERVTADLSAAANKGAVALGAAVILHTSVYVVRSAYDYFHPTPEMVQAKKERQAESERKVAEDTHRREELQQEKCLRDRRKSFSDCMSKNRRSSRVTDQGYPEECRDQAFDLSQQKDGESEVVRLAMGFMRHALDEKERKEKESGK